jgi:TolB-like protein
LTATISVEPFVTTDSVYVRKVWPPRVRAESLVAQFGRVPGLHARISSEPSQATDFILTGDVAVRGARLVVTTRLWRRRSEPAIWTATFWRGVNEYDTVVRDIATDAAEGVYAGLARRTLTSTRDQP